MALCVKFRRILLQRNGRSFACYIFVSCILFYLIITSQFVQRQAEPIQKPTIQVIDWNAATGSDDKFIEDKLLVGLSKRRTNMPDETLIPVEDLPCNPQSISKYIPKGIDNISCIPHRASQSACDFASKLYWRDDTLKSCGADAKKVQICKLKESPQNERQFIYECSFKDCKKHHLDKIIVWKFDPSTQNLEEHNTYTNAKKLEQELPAISKESSQKGYNFLFLECSDSIREKKPYDTITQLLILPPFYLSKQKDEKEQSININIVLLDSAARSHFYRSLPSTIEAFKKINENKESEEEVLDFQLFQAIEGHTAENLHALFTGTLFPKTFTGTDRENSQVGVGKMFQEYYNKGYHTFYHDDLCYDQWWGSQTRSWITSKLGRISRNLKGKLYKSHRYVKKNA